MSNRVKVNEDGYAILRALPLGNGNLVLTEKCPFCGVMHTHTNPKTDERGNIALRKSHCIDKSIVKISENGLAVGNNIYVLEVEDL